MTLMLKNAPFDMFKDFEKLFVGFDDTYNRMAKFHDDVTKNIPNYPPYNIRKVEDNKYVIELAVAGFARQDIDITFEDNKLIVSGKTEDDNSNFLFKGIANRAFTRTFFLDDTIEINDAAMMNGMLKIALAVGLPTYEPMGRRGRRRSPGDRGGLVGSGDARGMATRGIM